jgi:hypothetical protein
VVHGDLSGNVLFAAGQAPAIIDFPQMLVRATLFRLVALNENARLFDTGVLDGELEVFEPVIAYLRKLLVGCDRGLYLAVLSGSRPVLQWLIAWSGRLGLSSRAVIGERLSAGGVGSRSSVSRSWPCPTRASCTSGLCPAWAVR